MTYASPLCTTTTTPISHTRWAPWPNAKQTDPISYHKSPHLGSRLDVTNCWSLTTFLKLTLTILVQFAILQFSQGAIEEYRKIQDELLEKELLERKRKELDGVSTKRNIQVPIQLINLQFVNASRLLRLSFNLLNN